MLEKRIRRKYLSEFVYGSIDGTITTFAIVAGAMGASLGSAIILILGFANLFADGFSMAVSNYLSTKSQNELFAGHKHRHAHVKNPRKTAIATFLSFVIVGFVPLLSFVLAFFVQSLESVQFQVSIVLTGIAFLAIGAVKGEVVGRRRMRSAINTLLIGGAAALIAFVVGYLLRSLIV